MAGFKSVHDYEKFASDVRSKRRFIHPRKVSGFLRSVSITSRRRQIDLSAGSTLWRAQIGSRDWFRNDKAGHEWIDDAPFPPERMKPLARNPSEGRVNPRGIAYLYLASDRKTAISEVRPWSGALVSVASFRTTKELRLVDCSKNHGKLGGWGYLFTLSIDEWDNLSPEQMEEAVWADIDNAFSSPAGPRDEDVNYVPTQIIEKDF
jgi:RES domain